MSEQGSGTWRKSEDDQHEEVDIDLIIGAATYYIVFEQGWGTQQDVINALSDYVNSIRAEAWQEGWDAGAGGTQRRHNPYEEEPVKEASPTRQRLLDHLVGNTKGSK